MTSHLPNQSQINNFLRKIRTYALIPDKMQNLTKVIEDFHENGIAVVKGFATEAECDAMIAEMKSIVDKTDMKVTCGSKLIGTKTEKYFPN